jgi:rubredoxin-NAD+ reductase
MNGPVVILGSGLAGITVARELRKLDPTVALRIVTADDGAFYSKPMLSNALAGGRTADQLAIAGREALAGQLQAEILAGTRVTAIRPAERVVATNRGDIAYGRLVLALGARPLRLPLAGDGAGDVLSVNSLDDYRRFRERLAGRGNVAILGAGLIGCEFANDLRTAGIGVQVFDIAPQPLGRLLPPQAGAFYRDGLAAAGVEFRLGTGIARIERAGDSLLLLDGGNRAYAADVIVSAVGLQPETTLAAAAGLACGRGIVVDRRLAASMADIYAVGDCAEVAGLGLPFVMPIMQQARALARTLAGTPTEVAYPAMPVVVKTPACPAVVCPPPAGAEGRWREEAAADGVRALFEISAGRALGFALVGKATAGKQELAAGMPAWL